MRENNKKYGFVMSLYEFGTTRFKYNFLIFVAETIPTLWQTVRDFVALHPRYVAKDNSAHFMIDRPENGLDGNYNLCHVTSP